MKLSRVTQIDLIIRKFTKKKDIFNELAKANRFSISVYQCSKGERSTLSNPVAPPSFSLELVEMDERHLNKVTYRICNKNFASIIKSNVNPLCNNYDLY